MRYLLAVLMLCSMCLGQEKTTKSSNAFITYDAPRAELLVTLNPDGSIVYGEHYNPDAAARVFWEAMAERNPLKKRIKELEERLAKYEQSGIEEDGRSWTCVTQTSTFKPKAAPPPGK